MSISGVWEQRCNIKIHISVYVQDQRCNIKIHISVYVQDPTTTVPLSRVWWCQSEPLPYAAVRDYSLDMHAFWKAIGKRISSTQDRICKNCYICLASYYAAKHSAKEVKPNDLAAALGA